MGRDRGDATGADDHEPGHHHRAESFEVLNIFTGGPQPSAKICSSWAVERKQDTVAEVRIRTSSDSPLVERAVGGAKEGDPEAVHFLYVRYADDVCRYLAESFPGQHEAEETTHSVFAELMTAIDEYEQGELSFADWILQIAHNVALRR